jgi:hypothetical protein
MLLLPLLLFAHQPSFHGPVDATPLLLLCSNASIISITR